MAFVLSLTTFPLLLLSLTTNSLSTAYLTKRDVFPASNMTGLPNNWTYVGCYNDQAGSRTLGGPYTADSTNMNATFCVAYCQQKGFVYAGNEYSDECYCGDVLAQAATLHDDSDCSMGCAANSSEACGGFGRVSIYYANKMATPGPVTNPGPSGWTSYGCWTDGASRTLQHDVQVPGGGSNMTVAACTSACQAAGYSLAGVEYAGECYCDDHVSSTTRNTTLTDCNMACNGNSSEFCGAGNRLNLYASGSSTPSVKPESMTPLPPGGWFSLGCYNDSTASRTLSHSEYLQVSMTIAGCTAACANAGYIYAGVEYAGECYCDNSIQKYATVATDGRCNMACNGNNIETCGGPNGVNIFQFTGWYDVGCWGDTSGARTLTHQEFGIQNPTVEKCTVACRSAGYTLAGVEYGDECYCDHNAQNGGGPAPDGNAGCNMACQGNSDEICGGQNRLNVYQFNSTGPLASAIPTTTLGDRDTSGGSNDDGTNGGSTGSTPTPISNSTNSMIAPYTYQGCYTEGQSGRALQYQQPDNQSMTIESCVSLCSSQGYKIAGMEYSYQCFCDNYLRNMPTLAGELKCNMRCAGNGNESCGAGNILSVYSNGTMINYTDPSTLKQIGNWTYQGCLTDIDGARSLPYEIVWRGNNSNEACTSICQQFGYNAAGTEYSEQCWCGDVQNVINAGATIRPDGECNMVCSGDANGNGGHICGGGNRLSYYTYNGTLYEWDFVIGNAAGKYEFLLSGPVIPLVTSPGRNGKLTYLEKFGTSPANNGTGAYEFDPTLVSNYSAAWREMHVKTDVFCSASLTLPDKAGRQINVGGWANDATYGIRFYTPDGSPGVAGKNDWEEDYGVLHLLNGRWYPTAMVMANGSILVMGGQEGSNGAPVPTLEVLPATGGGALYCDYLKRTDPNNLYPFLAVTPAGDILVQYYNEAKLLDPVSLQPKRDLPNVPAAVNDFLGGRNYPFAGTFMIMPQHAPYTDYMRVLICGGSIPGPEIALDNCVSIAPDQPGANWTIERMPSKRVMTCMTALPDGTFLILNGAQQGRAGFGLATDPNTNAVLYDPTKPENFRMTVMANTTIARLYHSEAVLLDDGRVLVSGSDPEDVRAFAPQEYRNEVFIPPYLMSGAPRPCFNINNLDWSYGQQVTFTIVECGTRSPSVSSTSSADGTAGTASASGASASSASLAARGNAQSATTTAFTVDDAVAGSSTTSTSRLVSPAAMSKRADFYRVSLLGATSSTHGNSMGQRTYFPVVSCSGSGPESTCTVTAPPNANVCPPSWFQMFVLDGNGVPSHATWVRIGGDPAKLGTWPNLSGFTPPGMGAVEPLVECQSCGN